MKMAIEINPTLNPIVKLSRDLKKAATTLSHNEARFLVDSYYQMQDNRIRAAGQIRSIVKSDTQEPHEVLSWLLDQNQTLEDQIKSALHNYARSQSVGKWMLSIKGIGAVISAGMLAHIDITKAPTAGAIWKYAGLDPASDWKKGEKRPWNAELKTLCWKLGESFVKVSGKEDAFYGKIYKERKELELEKNQKGEYAEQAKAKLEKFKIGKDTDAYKAYSIGQLPPAHIHARAKRYAVKLFLSHLFEKLYWDHYKTEPPKPYAMAHLDHVHKIEAPE